MLVGKRPSVASGLEVLVINTLTHSYSFFRQIIPHTGRIREWLLFSGQFLYMQRSATGYAESNQGDHGKSMMNECCLSKRRQMLCSTQPHSLTLVFLEYTRKQITTQNKPTRPTSISAVDYRTKQWKTEASSHTNMYFWYQFQVSTFS